LIAELRSARTKTFPLGRAKRKGVGGEGIFAHPRFSIPIFSPPQFFVFRFAKCAAKECCPCPTHPYAGNDKELPKIRLLVFIKFGII